VVYVVLGSARTGLIFTGIQEGTPPGGLTPPGQTEQGILYHVPSCWVPEGMSGAEGTLSRLGSARRQSGRAAFCVVWFVLCFLLTCIIVVTVPFVCCSVKLPLSRPTGFCLFLSILLRIPVGGGAATWRFCCWLHLNPNRCLNSRLNINCISNAFFTVTQNKSKNISSRLQKSELEPISVRKQLLSLTF